MSRWARAIAVVAGSALVTASPAGAQTTQLVVPVMPLDLPVVSIVGAISIHRARVVVQSDVLFAFDSARLSSRAAAQLKMVTDELERRHARGITVEGYTDSRGSLGYNARLSQRRAEAVRAALGARFAARAVGRGEAAPAATNATAHGRALNRRVEIRFG
jgi:outer membrane protein OmpA-like peptidoglycan-associated protein